MAIKPFSIDWDGLVKVTANLNKEVGKIKKITVKNMLTAGLLVKGKALRKIPVDTANLKSSGYVIWGMRKTNIDSPIPDFNVSSFGELGSKKRFNTLQKLRSDHNEVIAREKKSSKEPFATIGFTAFYALFVHEDLTARHKVGQAKFLEQALLENKPQILSILRGGI